MCQLNGRQVNPDKDYCSKHAEELHQCEYCGSGTLDPVFIAESETWHTYCEKCASAISTCNFCLNAQSCAFETDPSPLPKMIQKQIRQENMVQIVTVKNPDRIAITCQKGCNCYHPEFECLRQFNGCEKMKHIYDKE